MKVMRNKLWYLVSVSLKRKIKSKWFLVANIIVGILIIGALNIDTIINYFGGDFNEKRIIYVVDNANAYDSFNKFLSESAFLSFGEDNNTYNIIKTEKSVEDLKKEYDNPDLEKEFWIVIFDRSEINVIDATVISKSYIDTIDYQLMISAINNTKTMLAIKDFNLTDEEINKLFGQIEIKREIIDEDKKSEDEIIASMFTTVFPVIILPFFILSILLIQNIGSEVNDEKTTRGMEIIISSVSPKKHFFAKVIAGNLFILIQSLLLIAFAAIGGIIRSNTASLVTTTGSFNLSEITSDLLSTDLLKNLTSIIPALIILMVLTFIGYSLLAGILASMTTNAEDFQHVQTPVTLLSLIGYYLAMMAGFFKGAAFLKILSYFPFISAILSPSLLVLGDTTLIDFIISAVLMIITDYLLIKYGLKIYKVGILNYSSKDLWKKMFKALKEK